MSDHVFEALSHPVRRKILQLLAERPRLYSELMEGVGVDSPTLAFHLKKLAGLVEKNEKGFYQLTEAGERAVKIIKEVEGVRPAEPAAPRAEDILLHDRALLKIDNALLELARREGRRIRIHDVAIVEVEKDVDPKLFYEVVEEIRDVGVVKTPRELRPYVEVKVRDVALVTTGGVLTSALKLGLEALTYLSPLKAFRAVRGPLREVYRGEFKHSGALQLEVAGGRVKLSRGPNFVVARCRSEEDFEIAEGRIAVENCEVEAKAEGLERLVLEVAGGYVSVEADLKVLKAEVTGGAVEMDVAAAPGRIDVEAAGGAFGGRIRYQPFDGESIINVEAAGGVVELELGLPEEVGFNAVSNVAGGVARLPPPRAGKRGTVILNAEVAGGVVEARLA